MGWKARELRAKRKAKSMMKSIPGSHLVLGAEEVDMSTHTTLKKAALRLSGLNKKKAKKKVKKGKKSVKSRYVKSVMASAFWRHQNDHGQSLAKNKKVHSWMPNLPKNLKEMAEKGHAKEHRRQLKAKGKSMRRWGLSPADVKKTKKEKMLAKVKKGGKKAAWLAKKKAKALAQKKKVKKAEAHPLSILGHHKRAKRKSKGGKKKKHKKTSPADKGAKKGKKKKSRKGKLQKKLKKNKRKTVKKAKHLLKKTLKKVKKKAKKAKKSMKAAIKHSIKHAIKKAKKASKKKKAKKKKKSKKKAKKTKKISLDSL